jgi:hypothetical protein
MLLCLSLLKAIAESRLGALVRSWASLTRRPV